MKKSNQNLIDQRRGKRWNLKTHLKIFNEDKETLLGHAVNIATKGMMVVSEDPIPLQKSFNLWIEIILEDGSREKMPLKALSVWSKRRSHSGLQDTGLYNTGFHIFRMPPAAAANIQRIIYALKSESN